MMPTRLQDYQVVKTVGNHYKGTGTFARVALVRVKGQRTFFALKMINKETLYKLKQVEHAKSEKRILQSLECPFIVKL